MLDFDCRDLCGGTGRGPGIGGEAAFHYLAGSILRFLDCGEALRSLTRSARDVSLNAGRLEWPRYGQGWRLCVTKQRDQFQELFTGFFAEHDLELLLQDRPWFVGQTDAERLNAATKVGREGMIKSNNGSGLVR